MVSVHKQGANAGVGETGAAGSQSAAGDAVDSVSAEVVFGKVLQLVRAVQTGMQNIDSSHGLSGSQLWALWHISAQPGLRVSELAEAMHLHHSTASNLLDKLEKRSLVRRERQVSDSRVVRLSLSAEGAAVVKDIPGPMQGRLRNALQATPDSVLRGLSDGVAAVLAAMARQDNK